MEWVFRRAIIGAIVGMIFTFYIYMVESSWELIISSFVISILLGITIEFITPSYLNMKLLIKLFSYWDTKITEYLFVTIDKFNSWISSNPFLHDFFLIVLLVALYQHPHFLKYLILLEFPLWNPFPNIFSTS